MTSQAPCRYVDIILITYDENKAKADIPTPSKQYMRGINVTQLQHTRKEIYIYCIH